MHEPRYVRIYYCTDEVRSAMATLPMDGLLQQGSKTLSTDEFDHLRKSLLGGRPARIAGPDCWFEYEIVAVDAA